jgi:hypothetical protein
MTDINVDADDLDSVVEFFIHDIDAHRVPDAIHQIVAKWAKLLDEID